MRTLHYLTDPALADLFRPGIVVGLAIAAMCSILSVLVVLKRLSFIGQGISHAAFGGAGLAAILGLAATGAWDPRYLGVVLLFCLGAAGLIAALSSRRGTSADTAIGIVLVAAMTLGAILLHEAYARAGREGLPRPANWETILFGSITGVSWTDAGLACLIAAGVVGAAWWYRRPLLFWAFDEPASPAFGVPANAMKLLLLGLITLAIVASMRLAGVVLATALLVLPGAAALHLSDRLWRVLALAVALGEAGALGGLVLSFEADWPTGPSIVGVLTVLYAAARLASLAAGRRV